MGVRRVIIRLKYSDPDGTYGNRWKDGTTLLFLISAVGSGLRAGESGKWDSDRQGDINSTAGSDHAVYNWNIVDKRVDVLSAGWQDASFTEVLVKLNGFNYIDRGSGSGSFRFRKSDVPISWKIEGTDETA